ncbi:right-handed parallel beta-helix repeat-containing protein [Luteimonas suaedae]|uniref:right-handed parallel beta-helix repeat-containing protein n=1 Tax=Luteimonas suaedae TaxID=2605430 RepID=UPI001CA7C5E0|nr:right-handed parallel beta-helix repeat-containing protein [Luteimonas suaedae]
MKNITILAIGVVLHIDWVRVLRSHGCRRGVKFVSPVSCRKALSSREILLKNVELVQTLHGTEMPRRDFLRKSFALALPASMVAAAGPALAAVTSSNTALASSNYSLPIRERGSRVLNVRNFGAAGDGRRDDTASFQAAIDALPALGGTVDVPAGTYMIDALTSVRLRSYMHLRMAPNAKLVAKPNSSDRYQVLYVRKVRDVEISGGQIVGERDQHAGTTGQWGHGVFVHGSSRVTIRDILISKCWGDGLVIAGAVVWQAPSIPSTDVFVANIVSTNNRRQGLSVGYVRRVKVYDSEFSNSAGRDPQCGVDIEPESGNNAYQVLFENCLVRGNARYGMQLYKNSQGVTVRRCTVENNGSCGIVTVGAIATYLALNTVRNNSATGIFIRHGTRNCQVSQNTSYGNFSRAGAISRTPFSMSGWARRIERDILMTTDVSDVRITSNHYR